MSLQSQCYEGGGLHTEALIKNSRGDYVSFGTPVSKAGLNESFELIRPLPPKKGRGYFTTLSLRPGLEMGISCCRFDQDYMARISLDFPMVCLGFCLLGRTISTNTCHPEPVVMSPGRSYIHYFKDPVLVRKTCGRQVLNSLVIRVSPDFLEELLYPNNQSSMQGVDEIQGALNAGYLFADHIMTPQMKTVLFQIFNCQHQNRIGKIYLESKALELIALKLEQVLGPTSLAGGNKAMQSDDLDRIIRARDLLVEELQYPPSLSDLARQVGMSNPRLNRGFRRVYGCTVFEHLRKERLVHARILIEEHPGDLTRIAFESGFCSSSHFAKSFAREYGILPSEYQNSLPKSTVPFMHMGDR